MQCICPTTHTHREAKTTVSCEFLLETFDIRAQNVLTGGGNLLQGGIDLSL